MPLLLHGGRLKGFGLLFRARGGLDFSHATLRYRIISAQSIFVMIRGSLQLRFAGSRDLAPIAELYHIFVRAPAQGQQAHEQR